MATVDKYQGQQNDIILLSLVRTKAVGHLRDVRRLTVAMSRARLGLYVVGRRELFGQCFELQPTMKQLMARPEQLIIVPNEAVGGCERKLADEVPPGRCIAVQGIEHLAALCTAMLSEADQRAHAELQRQWAEYHAAQALAAEANAAALVRLTSDLSVFG